MPIQPKRNIYAFGSEFLVCCPQCSKRATLMNHGDKSEPNVIFNCSHCHLIQVWQNTYNFIWISASLRWMETQGMSCAVAAPPGYGGQDVYVYVETSPDASQQSIGISFRLWLQTPCAKENLWCFNHKHLEFTKRYIQTSESRSFNIRSRERLLWLSEWIKQTEDKEAILNGLRELQLRAMK